MNKSILTFVKKNLTLVFAVLFYVCATVFYMGPSVWDCSNTLYGFGDNTAGPIWRQETGDKSILGGYQQLTNYPVGESTFSPVAVSFIGQVAGYKALSNITNPVCGYNLLNMIGFVSAAIVMFAFIRWLTRNTWIALLAGYAVSFTPYFQIKVGGHPGYGYQVFLIAALWSFLGLIQRPTHKRAALLGVVTGASFYVDPYFSLLVLTIILPMVSVWIILHFKSLYKKNPDSIKILKLLILTGLYGLVSLIPLFATRIHYSTQINSFVTESRGDIRPAAVSCSNYPHEYLLPTPTHPLIDNVFGDETARVKSFLYEFSNCGLGEDAVGIGLILILVVLFGSIVFVWEKLRKKRLYTKQDSLKVDAKVIYLGASAFILLAVLLALPPARIGPVPLPSDLLLQVSSIWRIISREYVVVNVGIVVLFSLYLDYFSKKIQLKKVAKVVIYLFIVFSLLLQYQVTQFFAGSPNTFSYSDAPEAYTFIKDSSSIKALAEYPIERSGVLDGIGYYLTMQSIHKKPILNSLLPDSPEEPIRSTIKNLSDPLTVPVLHTLGITTVVVHGVEPEEIEKIKYLDVIFVDNHQPFGHVPATGNNIKDVLVVAKIVDAPVLDSILVFDRQPPYNHGLITSPASWKYDILSGMKMSVRNLTAAQIEKTTKMFCFDIKASVLTDKLTILNESGESTVFNINQDFTQVRFTYKEFVQIETLSGKNFVMTNLGC